MRLSSFSLGAFFIASVGCGGTSGNAGNGGDGGENAGAGGQAAQGGGGQGQGGQIGQGGSTPAGIPIFVAQGHAGRTTISCDDGKTWVANRSDDEVIRCFSSPETDCDHHPGAGRGITYGNGYFVSTFGWGKPGSIRRSKNGFDWETTLPDRTFAGVVFGNGIFLAGERPAYTSVDSGATFMAGGDPVGDVWNVRRTGFAPHDGGRFLLAFESGATAVNISKDQGATWALPSSIPSTCAADMQWSGGFAYNGSAIVLAGGTGVACRSLDGGDTWTAAPMGGTVSATALMFTGGQFVTFGQADDGKGGTFPAKFTSADGETWMKTPTQVRVKQADGTVVTSAGPNLGAVARGDSGTYVGVRGGWQVWYEDQVFYRSQDGVLWDALEAGKFAPSHPIQFITSGIGEATACQ